ncbi:MAG TPA: hypothetical protein VHL34_03820 [Rhizomicrobium sp.]|jgi:hypothetical protein|nr:hypothetical protein [Rhizomicrobium sp.]
MATYLGTTGNDTFVGVADEPNDFHLENGGTDTATGGVDVDTFYMGKSFKPGDKLDGGAGNDVLSLAGHYIGGRALKLTSDMLTSVEQIQVAHGFDYNVTTTDATVAAGQTMRVSGDDLIAGDVLKFDGSAETDGAFVFASGGGSSVFTGGAGGDTFNLGSGQDVVRGNAGNDVFNAQSAWWGPEDRIYGGDGNDTLYLTGDLGAVGSPITLPETMLRSVENLSVTSNTFNVVMSDGNVAKGQTLSLDLLHAGTVAFDGTAETDGRYAFNLGGALCTSRAVQETTASWSTTASSPVAARSMAVQATIRSPSISPPILHRWPIR